MQPLERDTTEYQVRYKFAQSIDIFYLHSQIEACFTCGSRLDLLIMFSTLLLMKVCSLLVATASASLLNSQDHVSPKYAALILPTNVTEEVSAINYTASVNGTTILPDGDSVFDDIAWPESLAASNSSNISLLSVVAAPSKPSLGGLDYTCDAKLYGKNLNVASCVNALAKLPESDRIMTFGERGTGSWDGNLPYRILSTDGRCAIDISKKADAISDQISPSHMKAIARSLISVCVTVQPNTGGVWRNIGKRGNLALRVTSYRPNVHCSEETTPTTSSLAFKSNCREILDEMPADGNRQFFGPRNDSDPEIAVTLPRSFNTYRQSCQIFLDILVPTMSKDASDWYKICK